MTPQRFVFNPPATALFHDSATTRYLAPNAPSLVLEKLPDPEGLRRRHSAQLRGLSGLSLPDNEAVRGALFEDDLTTAFQAYRVRRLWVDDAHEREQPGQTGVPLGDAPPRALAADVLAAARMEALLGAAASADEEQLYLFNVIVALEWQPTPARLRRLQWAFRRASDYLYDVTNGTMAFGQVIFGDTAWMHCADIQILASNRYLPRSWVGGLFEPHKYTPIRLGRGLWVRDRRIVIDWDEPEGYRAIVHEWAHYALGMKDEYMRGRVVYDDGAGRLAEWPTPGKDLTYRLVVPERRVKSESIMASPQGNSELGNPLPIASDNMRRVISLHYPGLQARLDRAWSGPGLLPLPLPHFRLADALAAVPYSHNERPCAIPFAPQALLRTSDENDLPFVPLDNDTLPTGRREVFLIRFDGQGAPQRVIPQGEIDARAPQHGFTLLGAAPGDTLVLLDSDGQRYQVWTRTLGASGDEGLIERQWAKLEDMLVDAAQATAGGGAKALAALAALFAGAGWQRQSGNAGRHPSSINAAPGPQPLAVIPLTPEDGHKNSALVRLEPVQPGVAVFGLDGRRYPADCGDSSTFDLPSLDGYVLRLTDSGPAQSSAAKTIVLNDFSQGGPPATAPAMISDPIAAGAASGEALICCDVTDKSIDASGYRVVTTMSRGGVLAGGYEALSPIYTIASNLQLRESFTPTLLIVNVQADTARAAHIRVCLLDAAGALTPLPTYVAPNAAYGAAPLTAASVPALVSNATDPAPGPEGAYIERFVLAIVPDAALNGGGGAASGA